jgi:ketosteroid isomerase-like protein
VNTASARQVAVEMDSAVSERDGARYFACLSDNIRIALYGNHRLSRTYIGKDDLRLNMFGPVSERLEDGIRLTFKHVVSEGNIVVIEAEERGRSKCGTDYNNSYCFVVTVKDGKVIESHEYMDTQLVKEIIG